MVELIKSQLYSQYFSLDRAGCPTKLMDWPTLQCLENLKCGWRNACMSGSSVGSHCMIEFNTQARSYKLFNLYRCVSHLCPLSQCGAASRLRQEIGIMGRKEPLFQNRWNVRNWAVRAKAVVICIEWCWLEWFTVYSLQIYSTGLTDWLSWLLTCK